MNPARAPSPMQQLFLRVNNPQVLEHGSLPSFSLRGATTTIGSGAADWRLYDSAGSVEALHAQIMLLDGRFVLADLCGRTYINHHQDPLGRLKVVALRDMDLIRIGKYQVSVNIGDQGATQDYNVGHLRELEVSQLLRPRLGDDLLDALPVAPSATSTAMRVTPVDDPGQKLEQFLGSKVQAMEADPLNLLHTEVEPDRMERLVTMPNLGASAADKLSLVVDYMGTTRESISQPHHYSGAEPMTTDTEARSPAARADQAVDHIVSAPLINSLGIRLEDMDTEQAHYFLEQAGRSLQKAIQGLLALYQADKTSDIDLALLGRSYQAIEDNPLRMGMSYEDTAQALFSPRKSRVHLSAEHAIEESMRNVQKSQEALIAAIRESLQQLLQGLSPERLERRFAHYRSEHNADLDGDAEAWRMYKDYFAEMTSNRQTGLEKMFWEIFEQSYDRTMRQAENGGAL